MSRSVRLRALRALLGATSVVAVLLGGALTAAPALAQDCSSPLTETPAQLAACGYQAFPIIGQRTFADGSIETDYSVNGHPAWVLSPPPGWNPLAASVADRARYGVPSEPPAGTPSHDTWAQELANLHFVTPPSELIGAPVTKLPNQPAASQGSSSSSNIGGTSTNWSGHELATESRPTEAYGIFDQPVDNGTSCYGHMASFWTGIGGDPSNGSNDLGQNGTDIGGGAYNFPSYQAWYEVYPAEPYSIDVNFYSTPFAAFTVDTKYLGGGTYQFFFNNWGNGTAFSINQGGMPYDATTAEWIGERPFVNNAFTPLTNFGSALWEQAWAISGGSFSSAVGATPYVMTNNNNGLMAYPTGPNNTTQLGNGGFRDIWNSCS